MTPRVEAAVLMRDRISSLIPDPDVSIVSTSNNCLSVAVSVLPSTTTTSLIFLTIVS